MINRKWRRMHLLCSAAFLFIASLGAAVPSAAQDALLVVAHGANHGDWNGRVLKIVEQINWPGPKGVAFLMEAPSEHSLEHVARQLDASGAARIIVVPLLVSSYSEHYDEIRYYVGDRCDPPEHVHSAQLKTHARLLLAPAMDDDPLISAILVDQVRNLSEHPEHESVVLVAHGPNDDAYNRRWIERLRPHADRLHAALGFRRVEIVTLRDDAEKAVRDAATEELRAKVKALGADSRVLVVPVLISVGYIQQQIQKRLEALDYVMLTTGLADHRLTAEWVRQRALQLEAESNAQRPEARP